MIEQLGARFIVCVVIAFIALFAAQLWIMNQDPELAAARDELVDALRWLFRRSRVPRRSSGNSWRAQPYDG
jgi:hypothetical protein